MAGFRAGIVQGLDQATFARRRALVELRIDRVLVDGNQGEIRSISPFGGTTDRKVAWQSGQLAVKCPLLRLAPVVLVLGLGGAFSFRPLPAPSAALEALASGATVRVTATADPLTYMPGGTPSAGLIFYPGALVDPRAYAVIMHDLATRGITILIIKLPPNIAFLAPDEASGPIAAHPAIRIWTVGGHSLGGVVASSHSAAHPDRLRGLLLYAPYPAGELSQPLANTAALSLSGTNDGLATPAKVAASRPISLPRRATCRSWVASTPSAAIMARSRAIDRRRAHGPARRSGS